MGNKKTLSMTSMILGISPWITMWIPGLNLLNLPLAIAAVVVGHIAKSKEEKNAMRIIGLVLGYLSIGFTVLGFLLIMIGLAILF